MLMNSCVEQKGLPETECPRGGELAAEDILLEGSHADIAMWPSSRGELAVPAPLLPDDSFGDTAVEYRLGDEARDASFGDTAVEYLLAEAAEEECTRQSPEVAS